MNTPNNARRRNSQTRIENAFMQLLEGRDLHHISVSEICKLAGVNRTTFYANYEDIYALVGAVQKRLEDEIAGMYGSRTAVDDFLPLFEHMRDHQAFYNTYFRLGLDGNFHATEKELQAAMDLYQSRYEEISHMEYHIEFFRNGFNAVVKRWLAGGCRETPREMNRIIREEYAILPRGLTNPGKDGKINIMESMCASTQE